MSTSQTLPPSPRDFLAYERLIIDGFSTRQAAEELKISQTRVRQIVRRVADWLAENLPQHDEKYEAAQLRLAQHIAADRLHCYLNEAQTAWRQTRETKYLSAIIRLLTALTKLPAHPHTLLALAADDVVPSLREGHEEELTFQPPAAQRATAATTPSRSASEDKPPSISSPRDAATAASINPFSPPPQLAPSPTPSDLRLLISDPSSSPPPIRACSPPQNPASITNPNNPPTCPLSPSTETSSASNQAASNSARQAFLAPAHCVRDDAQAPAVTELKITPQSIGLTTKNHSTPRERRRLQRLLSKK